LGGDNGSNYQVMIFKNQGERNAAGEKLSMVWSNIFVCYFL
jgi:hypothetical protein